MLYLSKRINEGRGETGLQVQKKQKEKENHFIGNGQLSVKQQSWSIQYYSEDLNQADWHNGNAIKQAGKIRIAESQ